MYFVMKSLHKTSSDNKKVFSFDPLNVKSSLSLFKILKIKTLENKMNET